ncbi:unnamed protein product [Moneuplotes crassus]|uniref:BZIP domain-containing protein n=1 Tax=Euplotes crassus TaxID=5936 RepID=A0AAD1XPS8_EUPCR|nr:unnamed protein product [Moneuplotes crassus]
MLNSLSPHSKIEETLPVMPEKPRRGTDAETGIHTPPCSHNGSSDGNSDNVKIRLKKNRESACRSRLKKKQQATQMQEEYDTLLSENTQIQQKIDCCKQRISKVEEYNARLKKSIENMQIQQNLVLTLLTQRKQIPSLYIKPLTKNLNDIIPPLKSVLPEAVRGITPATSFK